MMYISEQYLNKKQKVIKTVDMPNYKVQDFKNPPKKDIKKKGRKGQYRSKVVYGKDGQRHVLRFAIMNKSGPEGGRTKLTSKWDKK